DVNGVTGGTPGYVQTATTGNDGQVQTTCYDRRRRPFRDIHLGFDGTEVWTDRSYDAFERLATLTRPYFHGSAGGNPHLASMLIYDALGRPTSASEDDRNHMRFFEYSGLGEQVIDEMLRVTRAVRDGAGHVMMTSTATADSFLDTSFKYGPFNELKSVTDPA